MRRRTLGMTLVEMLIALSIMAVLAMLSYRTVAAMTEASRHLNESGRAFDRLADAIEMVERDLSFTTDLPGELAFRGDGGADRPGEVRFVRAASGYLSGPDSAPVMVGYRLREGRLEKLVYPDNALVQPEVRPLLTEGVKALYFRFRDRTGVWRTTWPNEHASGLPAAVEMRIDLESGGTLVRMVALP